MSTEDYWEGRSGNGMIRNGGDPGFQDWNNGRLDREREEQRLRQLEREQQQERNRQALEFDRAHAAEASKPNLSPPPRVHAKEQSGGAGADGDFATRLFGLLFAVVVFAAMYQSFDLANSVTTSDGFRMVIVALGTGVPALVLYAIRHALIALIRGIVFGSIALAVLYVAYQVLRS